MVHAGEEAPEVVFVGGYPPNAAFGGGVALRRLLDAYPPDKLTVFCSHDVVETLADGPVRGGLLQATYKTVRPWASAQRGLRRLYRALNALRVIPLGNRIASTLGPQSVLLAVPWAGEMGSELYAAAYLAHRRAGRPLVVYEMDEWRASLSSRAGLPARILEHLFHGPLLRAASTVWVMTDAMAEYLGRRFGVDARVLSHCIELEDIPETATPRSAGTDPSILYAGAIYGAQADAIANVARAVTAHPSSVRLVIHSSRTSMELGELGVAGTRLAIRPLVPLEEMNTLLRSADALLLPYSFATEQSSVVRTSFPTKTIEYMASGVPILVHGPPDSTIVRLARRDGWGLVVDEPSVEKLGYALQQILFEESLRHQLVASALQALREQHDLVRKRGEFLASLRAAAAEA